MKGKSISTFFLILLFVFIAQGDFAGAHAGPLPVILDTDISSDVDDVGAVAVLHSLADKGEAEILAMMVSSGDPWSASCLDALNTYYGHPDISIGIVHGKSVVHESKYTREVSRQFPNDLDVQKPKPDAVHLYRKILSASGERSVVIVSVGYLTNLSRLLQSTPDENNEWDGKTLVKEKVKELICMGGQYPSGREWNFYQDASATADVVEYWPTPIAFVGYEAGASVLTGSRLRKTPRNNPLRRSYELYNNLEDRPSWDQIAVLYAVRGINGGPDDFWDLETKGYNHIYPDGSNEWRRVPDREHAYLIQKSNPVEIAKIIEELMVSPAIHGRKK